jgi:hypothetical protein
MPTPRFAWTLVLLTFSYACGDSDGTGASGASGGAGGEGGSPTTGGSGGAASVACGDADLTCGPTEVCVEETNEPDCTNLDNEADPCPDGTTKTNCGGAGIPCCCGPTPPSDYRCASSTLCAGAIDCECVAPCTGEDFCDQLADGTFRCEPPPEA